MAGRDMQYGLIAIVASVFFLIAGLDLLENALFSREFASLIAYVLVAIGAYAVAKSSK